MIIYNVPTKGLSRKKEMAFDFPNFDGFSKVLNSHHKCGRFFCLAEPIII